MQLIKIIVFCIHNIVWRNPKLAMRIKTMRDHDVGEEDVLVEVVEEDLVEVRTKVLVEEEKEGHIEEEEEEINKMKLKELVVVGTKRRKSDHILKNKTKQLMQPENGDTEGADEVVVNRMKKIQKMLKKHVVDDAEGRKQSYNRQNVCS